MATNKLTDALCKRAPTPDKVKKLADGHGLYLALLPSGSKVWRQKYRIGGTEQTEVFGPYPLLGLADARVKSAEFRRKLVDGVDVKAKPQKSITFGESCTQYWAGRKDVTQRYRDNATRGLDMHLGVLAGRPVGTLTRQDLLTPLMVLDAEDKHVYSRRVRLWASMVLDWAKEQGHCAENVASLINPKTAFGRAKVKHHAALKLAEVPDFLARLGMEKELQSVLAARMLMMTWVRTGEMRMMLWTEIEGDVWRIPEGKMKRDKEHLVPLPKQAVALLAKLKLRSRGSVYVFPNDRRLDRPMSENSVLYLIGRIGYGGALTGHGFRTVGSTWANENGYPYDAIERQLAHTPDDKVRAAYNAAEYLPARRAMLQDFADWLEQLDAGGLQGAQAPATL